MAANDKQDTRRPTNPANTPDAGDNTNKQTGASAAGTTNPALTDPAANANPATAPLPSTGNPPNTQTMTGDDAERRILQGQNGVDAGAGSVDQDDLLKKEVELDDKKKADKPEVGGKYTVVNVINGPALRDPSTGELYEFGERVEDVELTPFLLGQANAGRVRLEG